MAGLIPVFGEPFDAAHAGIYGVEGKMTDAATSAGAILPFGDIGKGVKYTGTAAAAFGVFGKGKKTKKAAGEAAQHINPGDLKNISAKDLKKHGIDPHEFKMDNDVHKKEISKFDIKVAPDGELVIVPHRPEAGIPPRPTGIYINK